MPARIWPVTAVFTGAVLFASELTRSITTLQPIGGSERTQSAAAHPETRLSDVLCPTMLIHGHESRWLTEGDVEAAGSLVRLETMPILVDDDSDDEASEISLERVR